MSVEGTALRSLEQTELTTLLPIGVDHPHRNIGTFNLHSSTIIFPNRRNFSN